MQRHEKNLNYCNIFLLPHNVLPDAFQKFIHISSKSHLNWLWVTPYGSLFCCASLSVHVVVVSLFLSMLFSYILRFCCRPTNCLRFSPFYTQYSIEKSQSCEVTQNKFEKFLEHNFVASCSIPCKIRYFVFIYIKWI